MGAAEKPGTTGSTVLMRRSRRVAIAFERSEAMARLAAFQREAETGGGEALLVTFR
ncbi:MAG: hypothetical protein J0I07_08870 [Myxococcales bacterium]|nr:hypothetical protein [Myxococcales bacterium]